jgi:hypothetical protein
VGKTSYAGNSSCFDCDAGYYSASGDAYCTACDAGYYSHVGSSSCLVSKEKKTHDSFDFFSFQNVIQH